jgi:CRISPR type I-E-associated protein CasB/Cse2
MVMINSTVAYIESLANLREGDLGILRKLRGSLLDESQPGFDLFSALWWPLRRKNQSAPKREVAWLVAKLYSEYRFEQKDAASLPILMGSVCRKLEPQKELPRVLARFDRLLSLDVSQMEHPLALVLGILRSHRHSSLDWVALTDDLSFWDKKDRKEKWTKTFMIAYRSNKEESDVD